MMLGLAAVKFDSDEATLGITTSAAAEGRTDATGVAVSGAAVAVAPLDANGRVTSVCREQLVLAAPRTVIHANARARAGRAVLAGSGVRKVTQPPGLEI
jgi:hypothetical protein